MSMDQKQLIEAWNVCQKGLEESKARLDRIYEQLEEWKRIHQSFLTEEAFLQSQVFSNFSAEASLVRAQEKDAQGA